jgi:hypothetical protein
MHGGRAVAWVRERYCEHAVETIEQEQLVEAFGDISAVE